MSSSMYNREFEFKDLNGQPRKQRLWFHLFETEVFKLFVEFQTIIDWVQSNESGEPRELDAEEVVRFYTSFEEILLSSVGKPSPDGLSFNKSARYEMAESVVFNAAMMYFVSHPTETMPLIERLLPDTLKELVTNQEADLTKAAELAKGTEQAAEIERLRAELAKRSEASGN